MENDKNIEEEEFMSWFQEAIFYHIYPLGLTGAPKENHYHDVKSRINDIIPWIEHIKEMGFTAIYIGPLFESVGHGYETTDYKKLDSRLGVNYDLQRFVKRCHEEGIRVIFDGVFNHTGRDFFAFQDMKKNRENSPYKDWYCNVNFYNNNEYNDGFSYDNWGGYNLLVKLNYRNPAVMDYICEVVQFWIQEFDVDGIRLDAADVLDFECMKRLRNFTQDLKSDFWLMGEVIHGDYQRWTNQETLHSVTNYQLHKALYSGHNDHNYFEIAHTVNRFVDMYRRGFQLYNFVDNHDVERIASKLYNKGHMFSVHILLYTLFGIPSIYYGSEFGIEGRKERGSDDSLRPMLQIEPLKDQKYSNPFTNLLMQLGRLRQENKVFAYGDYKELLLTNRQYAFAREWENSYAVVMVNNDEQPFTVHIPVKHQNYQNHIFKAYLSKKEVISKDGWIIMEIPAGAGEILIS